MPDIQRTEQIIIAMAVHQRQVYALNYRERNRQMWYDRILDRIAFALMDVAAILSWFTWTQERQVFEPAFHVHDGTPDHPVIYGIGLIDRIPQERWCFCNKGFGWLVHDGWRPTRYV